MDQACQQLAAAEGGQAEWRQPLQSLIDGDSQVGQDTEGRVVAHQPLRVATQTSRQREELNPHDRDRNGGLLRALGGAGDEPR